MIRLPDLFNGLSKEQYRQQVAELRSVNALEPDWRKLLQWVMNVSEHIHYYNLQDQKEGGWNELWKHQLLIVLIEIVLFDTEECKRKFSMQKGTKKQKETLATLKRFIRDKIERLEKHENDLLLDTYPEHFKSQVLSQITAKIRAKLSAVYAIVEENRSDIVKLSDEATEKDLTFFKILSAIREIQDKQEYYINQIEHSEELDPSLAVLLLFLKNYSELVSTFNHHLHRLPEFYLKEILKSRSRKALPDHTWIALEKTPGIEPVNIPEKTKFVAGKNDDDSILHYMSTQSVLVSDLQLVEVHSILIDRKEGVLPDARSGHTDLVTSIHRKEIPLHSSNNVPELFDHDDKNSKHVPVGWMMESPMLDLREGKRNVELKLRLTDESIKFLDDFLQAVCPPSEITETITQKIFEDAFFIQISYAEGWLEADSSKSTWYRGAGIITISFTLTEEIPPTDCCVKEIHGIETQYPAVQVTLNKNAYCFPYSWATRVAFEKLLIKVHVTGITSLKIYNDYGELDASMPFYPFGVKAKRGAWFILGNHEMSRKPLNHVILSCKWQQLPEEENGFSGHYALYRTRQKINNHSFRVRTEWLKERKWITREAPVCLFPSSNGDTKVEENGYISFRINRDMPASEVLEENYVPGKVRNGFLRVVLSEPEIGFGNELYRQLFTEVMLNNSRKKEPDPLPQEPISPMMSEIELSYEAEDTFSIDTPERLSPVRFYHIKPLSCTQVFLISHKKPLVLAQPTGQDAHLLFAFQNAPGVDRVRIFFDIITRKEEAGFLNNDGNRLNVCWYYHDGKGWCSFNSEAILQDTTHVFTTTGMIEMLLPHPVQDEWLDSENKFWLWAAIEGDYKICRLIRGFYLNVVEVIADGGNGCSLPCDSITQSELPIPGILSVKQLLAGFGGCPTEDEKYLSIRMAHRIAHRNRAITPVDYERMVLEQFPTLEKVQCITSTESGKKLITLVVMSREQGGKYPLCSLVTLQEIKKRLSSKMSPFATIEVMNPVYEKVRVLCRVKFRKNVPVGDTLRKLQNKINTYIAPWMGKESMPDLNRGISLKGLFTILVNEEGISELMNLSVQVINENDRERKNYDLQIQNQQEVFPTDVLVKETFHGGVFVPVENHSIEYDVPESLKY